MKKLIAGVYKMKAELAMLSLVVFLGTAAA